MNATVLYDLDHTLISCDSDYEWGQFLADSGDIDGDAYRARNQAFYNDYRNGTLDPVAYLKFVLAPLGQIGRQRLEDLRARFMETRIRPALRPRAQRLIAEHRERGLRQVVVTSTNAFIAEPVVQALGIPALVAPRPGMRAGQYTGELLGSSCFAADKPKQVQAWAEQEGIRLGETWGYSDSFNDIPLLEFVDHPVAVDPDPALRAHAQEQGWEIISLKGTIPENSRTAP